MSIKDRQERERQRRRNEILDAAEKIFFSKGIINSSMEDIAREAELSRRTLYLYFKAKEDLQFAIAQRGAEIVNKKMREKTDNNKKGLENLIELGRVLIQYSLEYKDYFELYIHFQSSKLNQLNVNMDYIKEFFITKSPYALLLDIVKQGIMDGSLRNDISENELAATLWSQMLGILVIIHNKSEILKIFKVDNKKVLETHFNIIINGCKNQ